MSKFNYVATVIGSTSVDCSVVGRFCGDKLNLILGKGNRLEILEITDGSLSQFSEIQVYGRVTLLLLFRPDGEKTDLLFVATKRYKYFLLQWDDIKSKVITRASGQLPDLDRPCVKDPICIIDPGCTLIAFYLFRNYIEVISCVQGQLRELDSKKLEHEAIDLKFLYGFTKPTIALLYKSSSDKEICYWLETLEIALVDKSCTSLVVPYSVKLSNKVKLLIPLPGPSYGGLIIGDKSILYLNDFISKLLETDNVRSTTKFYARLESDEGDDFRFLLVDKDGRLQLLLVNIVMGKCELKIDFIGETSVLPSTISSIGKEVVFIGSRSGDSQLMKLNSRSGLFLEALESFVNIGPILDFCVVEELEAERQGKRTIITSSGVKENASLRILRYGYMIQKMASVQLEDIMGLWSLRSTDGFEKFLVISFVSETWIFAMTAEEVLEETEIEGFSSGVRTYYSHDAAYEQMIQISSSAVRLICSISRKLLDIWEAPDFFINVATANMMQVLVAGRDILVYLEIGKGVLNMRKHEKKFNVSCLDITPVDEDSEYSKLAAVGMWNDTSTNTLSPRINILSLPTFQCLISVPLGEIVPRSLLLCAFEGIPYLLCGTGDGLLIKFLLDKRSGCLTEKTHLSLGSQPVSLLSFTCKAATLVVATSDKPSIIYISKRKLISSSLDLKEMTFMCSFNSASFPNRYNKPTNEYIGSLRLLDIETFGFISDYPLHQYEFSMCLISCSFSNDNNAYYCVGTGFVDQNGDKLDKGRVLVLLVEDGKLKLVAKKEISSNIPSLNAFQGKLLASVLDKIYLYEWKVYHDGTCGLQLKSVCGGLFTCRFVESRDKTVALGGHDVTLALLILEDEKGSFKQLGCLQANSCTAIKILDNDTYLASDSASTPFKTQFWSNN